MGRAMNLSRSIPAAPVSTPEAVDPVDFVVVDVETACSRASSICQIGIVGFRDGREAFAFETLVDPCDEFHSFNTRIHGIAAHHIVGQPDFGAIHPVVDRYLAGRTTVAHSHFDKGALAAACRVHGCPAIETTWLDSVRVAKRAWPELGSHKLNVLSSHLGIAHKHHDALSDARAAGMVIVKAIDHTGIALQEWLMPPPRLKPGRPPPAAASGPLKGHRVAILGEPRDGQLAHAIAGAGGRVVSSVGLTTTILAVVEGAFSERALLNSGPFVKAQEFRRNGRAIQIMTERELRGHFGLV